MERLPGFLVDFGLEGRLERLVRVVCAEEVGVADEEALLVVVGIDEPAGDAVGVVTADITASFFGRVEMKCHPDVRASVVLHYIGLGSIELKHCLAHHRPAPAPLLHESLDDHVVRHRLVP